MEEFSGKSSGKWVSRQKKDKTKSNRTRQKNKRGDSKVESNDNPEIPDSGETLDIPGLPSVDGGRRASTRRVSERKTKHVGSAPAAGFTVHNDTGHGLNSLPFLGL